jgi:hypothetical protein
LAFTILPTAAKAYNQAVKRRWTWNIFCALSLLILATSAMLWVRSYVIWDQFESKTWGEGEDVFYSIDCSKGALGIYRYWEADDLIQKPGGWGWSHHSLKPQPLWNVPGPARVLPTLHFLGLHLHHLSHTTDHGRIVTFGVALPLWLFLIFAVPPLLWWRGRRKIGGRGFPVAAAGGSGSCPTAAGREPSPPIQR